MRIEDPNSLPTYCAERHAGCSPAKARIRAGVLERDVLLAEALFKCRGRAGGTQATIPKGNDLRHIKRVLAAGGYPTLHRPAPQVHRLQG